MTGKIWPRTVITSIAMVFTLPLLVLNVAVSAPDYALAEDLTAAPARAIPNPAYGNMVLFAGIALSEYTIQLILAAAIAIVIAAIIIIFFSNMGKHPGKKGAEMSAIKPRPRASPGQPKRAVKDTTTVKKSEDISQDYLYGLVMGNTDGDAKRPRSRQQKRS